MDIALFGGKSDPYVKVTIDPFEVMKPKLAFFELFFF
jgi:hypothetical protein